MNARKPADRFILTIDLGNEAMQTSDDVVRAIQSTLRGISNRAAYPGDWDGIRDVNGNKIGTWKFIRRRA